MGVGAARRSASLLYNVLICHHAPQAKEHDGRIAGQQAVRGAVGRCQCVINSEIDPEHRIFRHATGVCAFQADV